MAEGDLEKNAEYSEFLKKDGEEDPRVIAQRLLNIFRQLHIFTQKKRDEFNQHIKEQPYAVKKALASLPGGGVLLEYLNELEIESGGEALDASLLAPSVSSYKDKISPKDSLSQVQILAQALSEAKGAIPVAGGQNASMSAEELSRLSHDLNLKFDSLKSELERKLAQTIRQKGDGSSARSDSVIFNDEKLVTTIVSAAKNIMQSNQELVTKNNNEIIKQFSNLSENSNKANLAIAHSLEKLSASAQPSQGQYLENLIGNIVDKQTTMFQDFSQKQSDSLGNILAQVLRENNSSSLQIVSETLKAFQRESARILEIQANIQKALVDSKRANGFMPYSAFGLSSYSFGGDRTDAKSSNSTSAKSSGMKSSPKEESSFSPFSGGDFDSFGFGIPKDSFDDDSSSTSSIFSRRQSEDTSVSPKNPEPVADELLNLANMESTKKKKKKKKKKKNKSDDEAVQTQNLNAEKIPETEDRTVHAPKLLSIDDIPDEKDSSSDWNSFVDEETKNSEANLSEMPATSVENSSVENADDTAQNQNQTWDNNSQNGDDTQEAWEYVDDNSPQSDETGEEWEYADDSSSENGDYFYDTSSPEDTSYAYEDGQDWEYTDDDNGNDANGDEWAYVDENSEPVQETAESGEWEYVQDDNVQENNNDEWEYVDDETSPSSDSDEEWEYVDDGVSLSSDVDDDWEYVVDGSENVDYHPVVDTEEVADTAEAEISSTQYPDAAPHSETSDTEPLLQNEAVSLNPENLSVADDAVSDEAISEKDVPHGEEFHFEDAAKPVDLFEPKHGDKIEFPMIAESEDASDASLSFAKLSGLNDADNPESDPYNKPQS